MALTSRADRPEAAGARVVVTAQLDTAKEFCRPTSTSWEPGLNPYLHTRTPVDLQQADCRSQAQAGRSMPMACYSAGAAEVLR